MSMEDKTITSKVEDLQLHKAEVTNKLDQPSLTLLDPYKWGWPLIGPIQNVSDIVLGDDSAPLPLTEQMSTDDTGLENSDSMDIESFQRSFSYPTSSLDGSEFGMKMNKSVITRNKSFSDNIKKACGTISPTISEECSVPIIENPHLVSIECEVAIGDECFPLHKTWDLSQQSDGCCLNRNICTYARHVALELGLPFHEEWRLVTSIQDQLVAHVEKLEELRHLHFQNKYGNISGGTKLDTSLAKEEGADKGPEEQSLGSRVVSTNGDKHESTKSVSSKKQSGSSKRKASGEGVSVKRAQVEEVWIEVKPEDHNTDICGICNAGGDLLCCDRCPRAFHLDCLKVKEEDLPPGDWICHGCDEDDRQFNEEPLLLPSSNNEGSVMELASEILNLVMSHYYSPPFLDPLDTDSLGVTAKYDELVLYRMDLNQVKKRLKLLKSKRRAYSILDFIKDVRTVWHNCVIFNAEGSAIARMAKHLAKMFETAVTNRLLPILDAASTLKVDEHAKTIALREEESVRYWREAAIACPPDKGNTESRHKGGCRETDKKKTSGKEGEKRRSKKSKLSGGSSRTIKPPPPPVDKNSLDHQPCLGTISSQVQSPAAGRTPTVDELDKFEFGDMDDIPLLCSPLSPLHPLSSSGQSSSSRSRSNSSKSSRKGTPSKPFNAKHKESPSKPTSAEKTHESSSRKNTVFEDDSDFESPVPRKRGRPPSSPARASSSAKPLSPKFTSPKKTATQSSDQRASTRVKESGPLSPLDTGGALGPNRDTREAKLWNQVCALNMTIGSVVYKDFGMHGIFKGKVMSFKYPYISIKYEDNDVEDLEPAEFARTMREELQAGYRLKYSEQKNQKK